MRRWTDRRATRRHALDLDVEVAGSRLVHLDHVCAAAGVHRLLGIELTDGERALLRDGEIVAVAVACDRCIWERRLLLRLAGETRGSAQHLDNAR